MIISTFNRYFIFALKRVLTLLFKTLIRAYQLLITPLTPPSCRFIPTCSTYALEAVKRFGPIDGSLLAAQRICRCHPWGSSGYDPVPLLLWKKVHFYPLITQHNLYNPPFMFKLHR